MSVPHAQPRRNTSEAEAIEATPADYAWLPSDGTARRLAASSPPTAQQIAEMQDLFSEEMPGYPVPARTQADPADKGTQEQSAKNTVAATLVHIGETAELFHDERRDAFVAIEIEGGGRRILRVRGTEFRRWLARQYYLQTGKPPNGEAVAAALAVLEAQADFEGSCLPLEVRLHRTTEAIWIDMADEEGRAVRVSADGWAVEPNPPILFRRFSHQRPLPTPVPGGNLNDLLNPFGLQDSDKVLLVSWLVVSLVSDIPRPVLVLHGPQGAAKTTLARMIRDLVDPSAAETLDLGRDVGELAQMLDHHCVPCFDNLTKIQGWQSDLLCKAVSGGAFTKRQLFTDGEDILLTFRRAIIATGINVPATSPDLLDRCLLIGLERIPPEQRMEEGDLWAAFDAAKSKLLGAVLTALAGAMRIYPTLRLPALPRMADFSKWGEAAAQALGYPAGAFLAAITANGQRQTEEVLDGDPVAQAVRKLAEDGSWSGTAGDLLVRLTDDRPDPASRGDGWPRQANSLSRRLNVLRSTLADVGILVTFSRSTSKERTRSVEIRKISSESSYRPKSSQDAGSLTDDTGKVSSEPSGVSSGFSGQLAFSDDTFPASDDVQNSSSDNGASQDAASDDMDGSDDDFPYSTADPELSGYEWEDSD